MSVWVGFEPGRSNVKTCMTKFNALTLSDIGVLRYRPGHALCVSNFERHLSDVTVALV